MGCAVGRRVDGAAQHPAFDAGGGSAGGGPAARDAPAASGLPLPVRTLWRQHPRRTQRAGAYAQLPPVPVLLLMGDFLCVHRSI